MMHSEQLRCHVLPIRHARCLAARTSCAWPPCLPALVSVSAAPQVSRPLFESRAAAAPWTCVGTAVQRLSSAARSSTQSAAAVQLLRTEDSKDQQAPPARQAPERRLPADQELVFCYGSNMGISSLHEREVLKVSSRDPATVEDPGLHLVFTHHGGAATLATMSGRVPKFLPAGGKVHGVLYQVSSDDLKKLKGKMGGYSLSRVKVRTYDGVLVDAAVFVSSPLSTLPAEVVPTESYMRLLRQGAADNYLDPAYQAFLSSIPTVTSAGLPADYYTTPAKRLAYGWAALATVVAVAAAIAATRR